MAGERFLKNHLDGARAAYWAKEGGAGTLFFGMFPTRLEVIEELIHHGQRLRLGFPSPSGIKGRFLRAQLEIEAQHTLLKIIERKGWSRRERELIEGHLEFWMEELRKLTEEFGDQRWDI